MKRRNFIRLAAVFLSVSMLISICSVSSAMAVNTNNMEDSSSNSTISGVDFESSDINSGYATYAWKAVFKATKWALKKLDIWFFDREPTIIDKGGNWVASSSGDVSFGNGVDDALRVKFTSDINYTNNHLDVFAQTGVTGWLSTITIFIENSNGTEVGGGQVTHGQHVATSYNLPLDTYTTYYVYSGERDWDCWIYRYDFRYTNSASIASAGNNTGMVYNPLTQKSYVIPSDIESATVMNMALQRNRLLTSEDLVNEFQDDKLNCSVNRLKNYDIGDIVYVQDVIVDLEYDPVKNTTVMYYGNTEESCFEWPFAGDLRDRFDIGDIIKFKFRVVEEYATDEYTFESLDYFLESYELMDVGSAANIDDYLAE